MAITPIQPMRVSFNLQSLNLLDSTRRAQVGLFRYQNQLATGLKFQRASENIVAAAAALRIDRRLETLEHVGGNLREANAALAAGESAMQDAVNLLMEAKTLALQLVGDTVSAQERDAMTVTVDSLLEQMVSVGNRQHLGTYLFSGHVGGRPPFELALGGVLYHGDEGRLATILDTDFAHDTFTIPGAEFYSAYSSGVQGSVDLNPALTPETRLSDLRGASGDGIDTGRLLISDGTSSAEIDISGADTIGDVIDLLNAEMPGSLQATLVGSAIRIGTLVLPPPAITVTDAGGGKTAIDLGIFTEDPVPAVLGHDLDPMLTPRVQLDDLLGGVGVSLDDGIVIHNGSLSATISFSSAQTIEDVLNAINQADVGVVARINPDDDTIEVLNRLSGTELRIEENGGGDAAALGIRSLDADTPLAALNGGLGVDSVDGDDFRITTASGTQIDIDIDDLDLATATMQDVLDLINAVGAGAVTASLGSTGNGIVIADNTSGAGTLSIVKLNLSPTIDSLGLNVSASGGQISGADVNPVTVNSPFTALIELRAALERDDTRGISLAAERLEGVMDRMLTVQGELAAKASRMLERAARVDSDVTSATVQLSDVRDADIADAVVRFQQVQTALQANLSATSRILNLSILDYLR